MSLGRRRPRHSHRRPLQPSVRRKAAGRRARVRIHRAITTRGTTAPPLLHPEIGRRSLDAAVLRASQVRFLEDRDPRISRRCAAVAQHLGQGVLVRRYRTDEMRTDHHGEEGAFLMSSFWLVDALAHTGELEEAERRFERLLALQLAARALLGGGRRAQRRPARQLPAGVHPPGPGRRRGEHRAGPPPPARASGSGPPPA